MFLATVESLEQAGYEQYEISNYARPGCQSQHNLIYWRNQPYIGVGPSAAGCLPVDAPAPALARRYKNIADIAGYIRMMGEEGRAEAESETVDRPMLMLEMILMQLRLREGLSPTAFRERTGLDPITAFGDALPRLAAQGLIQQEGARLHLTRLGFLQANHVMSELAASLDAWKCG